MAYALVATSTPGATSVNLRTEPVYHPHGRQLHFESDASTKLFTELTTPAASLPTVTTWAADGLDGRAATELLSVLTEDVIALVSLGKSLLAELTSVLASLSICLSCDLMPLIPLLVSPLTEFWRLVRSVQ
jgi:hypothetical protein